MDGGLRKQQANGCLFLSGTKQKPGLEPRKGGAAACSGRKKNEKIVVQRNIWDIMASLVSC